MVFVFPFSLLRHADSSMANENGKCLEVVVLQIACNTNGFKQGSTCFPEI
jgi:hypothetical protein